MGLAARLSPLDNFRHNHSFGLSFPLWPHGRDKVPCIGLALSEGQHVVPVSAGLPRSVAMTGFKEYVDLQLDQVPEGKPAGKSHEKTQDVYFWA